MASLPGYISDTELYYETTEIESKNNLLTGTSHTVEGRDNVIAGYGGSVTGDRVALLNMTTGAYSYTGSDAIILRAATIEINGSDFSGGGPDINSLLDGLGT